MFPDPATRDRYSRHFFEMHARHLLPQGLSWRVEGAGSLWAGPGEWRQSFRDDLRLAAGTIGGIGRRAPTVSRGMLGVEKRHPREPHVYLAVVGVRPDQQGRGLGSALIRPGTDWADAHGLPCYLESSNPRNIPLYRRHGFEVTGEVPLPDGPTMTLMWRATRAARGAVEGA